MPKIRIGMPSPGGVLKTIEKRAEKVVGRIEEEAKKKKLPPYMYTEYYKKQLEKTGVPWKVKPIKVSVPKLPKFRGFKLPEVKMPKLPKVSMPKLPEIKMPKLPEIKLPKFKLPLPKISKKTILIVLGVFAAIAIVWIIVSGRVMAKTAPYTARVVERVVPAAVGAAVKGVVPL